MKSDEEKTEAFPLTFIPRRIEEEYGEDKVVKNLVPKITCATSSWTIDEKETEKGKINLGFGLQSLCAGNDQWNGIRFI